MQSFITLLLLLLLCIMSPSLAQDPADCHVPGQCNGIALGDSHADSYNDCLQTCKDKPNCNWFTFFGQSGQCVSFLDCPAVDPSACSACTSGHVECAPDVTLVCARPGACVGSPVAGSTQAQSGRKCLELCRSVPECEWFSFLPTGKECVLTADCTEVDEGCLNCISGQRECAVPAPYRKLMVVGGAGNASNLVELFDLASPSSSCPAPSAHPVPNGSTGVHIGGVALVCGGYFDEEACYFHDRADDLWVETDHMNFARRYAVGVQLSEDTWWVTGSFFTDSGPTTELYRVGEGFSYHVDLPASRYYHSLVKVNETHVLLTGGSSTRSVWMFDINNQTWAVMPDLLKPRYSPFAGLITHPDGSYEVVVAGGSADNSSEILSLDSNTWRLGPSLPLKELYGGCSVQLEDTFLLVGGRVDGSGGGDQRSLLRLDVASMEWEVLPQVMDEGRYHFSAFLVPDDYAECA